MTAEPVTQPPVLNLEMSSDPRLIVGWREGKKYAGRRVALDGSVNDDFRAVATETMAWVKDAEARTYEPNAALDPKEQYFLIPVADLPTTIDPKAAEDDLPQSAALLDITSNPDGLERVQASALKQHNYLFYGLVFDVKEGGTATFLKKQDPVRTARATRINLTGVSALRRQSPPTLTITHGVDLIATPQQVFVLRKTPFDALFRDVKVALADVPSNISATREALAATVPMDSVAVQALNVVASKRPTYAVRLRAVPERLSLISLTPERVRALLAQMGNEPGDLLKEDEFSFKPEKVGLFLEVVEGRHFGDFWTGDRMRADRMSRHSTAVTTPTASVALKASESSGVRGEQDAGERN